MSKTVFLASCLVIVIANDTTVTEEIHQLPKPVVDFPVLSEGTVCAGDKASWPKKPFEPMRIKVFKADTSGMSGEREAVILRILTRTLDYFRKLLYVRRADHPIVLENNFSCHNAGNYWPAHVQPDGATCHKNAGTGVEDADYVLYFFSFAGEYCQAGTLAYALSCGESPHDMRPIVGYANICPLLDAAPWNEHVLEYVLRHELMHAMGFSSNEFGKFYNPDTGTTFKPDETITRTWRINSVQEYQHRAQLITTPRVREFVRNHFNCPDLEGAEIENEGGGGTMGTHWEKRLFGPELMTGIVSRRLYLSNLTLAFLEDSGWYLTNRSMAHALTYGKNAGCVFAKQSCREYMDTKPNRTGGARPFCNWADYVEKRKHKATARECSGDRTHFSQCNWIESDDNSSERLHYFADKSQYVPGVGLVKGTQVYGGGMVYDDCPVWSDVLYGDRGGKHRIGDSICVNPYSQPYSAANYGAELYGNQSICLKQDTKFEVFTCGFINTYSAEPAYGAGCYKYRCYRGRLMIQANYSSNPDDIFMQQYKVCWSKGSLIHIGRHQYSASGDKAFHKGVIRCPSCAEICERNLRTRKFNFTCEPDVKLDSTDYRRKPCGTYEISPGGGVMAQASISTLLFCILTALLTM